jgi:hypothetical protein
MPCRLIHTARRPKVAASAHVPGIRRLERDLIGSNCEPVHRELIDLGMRLEYADLLDREDGIEHSVDPCALRRGCEHPGLAIRKKGDPELAFTQPAQGVRHLGIGVQRQVRLHQRVAQGRIDAGASERVVECVAGHLPKARVTAHQRAQPSVLKLLGAPQLGQSLGVLADPSAQTRDRGVHVEQRAVRVEYARLNARHARRRHDAGVGFGSGSGRSAVRRSGAGGLARGTGVV